MPWLIVFALVSCQEATPWVSPPDPDPPEACDGDGAGCVGRCCEPGYSCQRGQRVDASADRDLDGRAAYEDCDDYDDTVFFGAPELYDGVDNNCNDLIDEGVRDGQGECAECRDADGDGHSGCDGDCDDADPLVGPGMIEVCDGRDNDCSGAADDGDALCGASGECLDGECAWRLEATGAGAWHRCGSAAASAWCSGADCESGTVMVGVPEAGLTDLPLGTYEALFRAKVDRFPPESECGRALILRLRVVDLDDSDDAGCAHCFERCSDCADECAECTVGGATNVLASTTYFAAPDTYAMIGVPFVIDAPRLGHRIQAVAIREGCMGPQVCIRRVRIEAR